MKGGETMSEIITVNKIGTGTDDDPIRPDIPDGWVTRNLPELETETTMTIEVLSRE